jgi:hypothetical protein
MKQAGACREPGRRSRQSFRSPELLASLTLSAEEITLRTDSGNPEEAAARAASRRATRASIAKPVKHKPRAPTKDSAIRGITSVSSAKLLTSKKLKSMRKYRLGVHGHVQEGEEGEGDIHMDGLPGKAGRRKSLVPTDAATLPGLTWPSPLPKSPSERRERHDIGKFETRGSTWKATIEGEVEKFMYPSLRLEALYTQDDPSMDGTEDGTSTAMPSPKTIDEVLTTTAKVSWELEHALPSPVVATAVQQVDSKRLRFDQKLQDAEAVLRKREAAALRLSATLALEQPTRKSGSVDPQAVILETIPALCHEAQTPRQQPIPRLPQARKYVLLLCIRRSCSPSSRPH